MFRFGSEDLIYKKLYKKNMDGKNSFASPKVGLERLVKSDWHALISNDAIHNFETFHCKVSIFDSIFEERIEA